MSQEDQTQHDNGMADAIAATAVITLVIVAVVFWLSGMPS